MENSDSNQSVSSRICYKRKSETAHFSVANRRSPAGCREETKNGFANDDIAIEVLSGLPIESTNKFKCVCKRWCELLSHPSFRTAHFQRSAKTISGLFVQGLLFCRCCGNYVDIRVVDYVSIGEDGRQTVNSKVLDFLPEKVVVIASCSGLLLCRNSFVVDHSSESMRTKSKPEPMEVVLYLCNPLTKEWTSLKPGDKYENGCCYGFVHNPVGSSGGPDFEVVLVERPLHSGKDPYGFKIYSSRIGTWRTSKVVSLRHRLHAHQSCFANGVFYWLTTDHSILTDLKQERAEVIKLPGNPIHRGIAEGSEMCIGVSDGNLLYACINMVGLMIWVHNYDKLNPKWDLKYAKPQLEMHHPHKKGWEMLPTSRSDPHKWSNQILCPYALQDDILYMVINGIICTYNIKTGKLTNFAVLLNCML